MATPRAEPKPQNIRGPVRMSPHGGDKLMTSAMHLYVQLGHHLNMARWRMEQATQGHVRVRYQHQVAAMEEEIADMERAIASAVSAKAERRGRE